MLADMLDLDDSGAVLDADSGGWLRAAASAGAQVRVVSEAESMLRALTGMTPRAVVAVASPGPAADGVETAFALAAPHVDVPLVVAPRLPRWVGPLDVVIVAGTDPASPELAEAAAIAGRRGAELIVAGPLAGPLAEAASGRALDLSPRVPVPDEFTYPHFVAVTAAVIAAVAPGAEGVFGAVADRGVAGGPPDGGSSLSRVADAVDAESLSDRAGADMFANAAKSLAMRWVGREIALCPDEPALAPVARHGSAMLLTLAGRPAAVSSVAGALAARPDDAPHDIFADPFLDPIPVRPVLVEVITSPGRAAQARHRLASLSDVDVVAADSVVDVSPMASATLTDALVLATRIDFAAAYLRLIGAGGAL